MTIDNPCDACSGGGRVEYDAVEEVQIPAGVASEVQLRIANKGEPGDKGGPAGHLFVHVQVSAPAPPSSYQSDTPRPLTPYQSDTPRPAQQPLHTHAPPAPPVAKENLHSAGPP